MLDLTALEARFRNLSSFGCKAAGGKVLLFYPEASRARKKTIPDTYAIQNQKVRDCREK